MDNVDNHCEARCFAARSLSVFRFGTFDRRREGGGGSAPPLDGRTQKMVEKMQEGRRTGVRRPSDSHSPGLRSGRSIQSLEDGPGCLDAGGASLGLSLIHI